MYQFTDDEIDRMYCWLKMTAKRYNLHMNDDAISDLHTAMCAVLNRYDGKRPLRTYAIMSFRYACMRYMARCKPCQTVPFDDELDVMADYREQRNYAELESNAKRLISTLPIRYRPVAEMLWIEGAKVSDIAERLNVTHQAIYQMKFVIINRLRETCQNV